MVRVLNIIESLSLGGAARTVFGTAKYSSNGGLFEHSIVSLAPHKDDAAAHVLATASGMIIEHPDNHSALLKLIAEHDIVLLQWWNSPEMDNFVRTALPPCRLAAWIHVGGHHDPQSVPPTLMHMLDFTIAGSPYTLESPAFASLAPDVRAAKTAMVYDATDFARLEGVRRVPHDGFNIGYIGTVDFSKMHPNFIQMSAAVRIPDARFVVCGPGGDQATLKAQAAQIGRVGDFDVRGMVHDIGAVLSILDAYGYPLCEDNYAAAELNLQEVMFCGIPPVVFPYGGVKHLVMNDFTGYVVHSEREYAQALEHLYKSPEDRERIGRNAQVYACQIFGAEHAARRLNPVLDCIMRLEKRPHSPPTELGSIPATSISSGAQRFLDSLGNSRDLFLDTLEPSGAQALFHADNRIVHASALMKRSGIRSYRSFYTSDPFLCFWSGLAKFGDGQLVDALVEFSEALKLRFPHWRAWWYAAVLAQRLGQVDLARQSLAQVRALAPEFREAKELQDKLGNAA
jgi:glycosyltransferase involved in cell wall biosynthesis